MKTVLSVVFSIAVGLAVWRAHGFFLFGKLPVETSTVSKIRESGGF